MPYSDFKTLDETTRRFNLTLSNAFHLFKSLKPQEPSQKLLDTLQEELGVSLAIDTEKARSEMIVVPILKEVRHLFAGQISYFSGSTFNVDPASGLNGEVDFLLSASTIQIEITAPVLTLVEAKNADTKLGLGQCAAQMVAAQRFNQERGIDFAIWGASTTGDRWRFLRLEENQLQVDLTEYTVPLQLSIVLGILSKPFRC